MSEEPFDLIAIGGGIAGIAAALVLAESGRRVVVLERKTGDRYVNATRMCGGVFHCALRDPRTDPEELVRVITEVTRENPSPARVRALAENALRSIRWLQARGIEFMRTSPYPHHAFVLSPPNISRRGPDWTGRGGDVLLRTLEARLIAHGGLVKRGFQVERLEMDNGRCTGVAGTHNGTPFEIEAKNVLIADGGFQSHPQLVGEEIAHAPEKLLQRNGRSGFGFGLRMAREIGAQISSLKGFYGHIQTRDAIDNPDLWPYPWWDDIATRAIVVEGNGQRFCDERKGGIFIANRLAELPDPQSAFVVFDHAIWDSAGRRGQIAANPNFVRAGATIHWSDILNDLALKSGLPPAQFIRTVETFNADADGDAKKRQITHPPFYAAPICAGITYTMGGIVIDERSRVLNHTNTSIPSLFAAGSTTGGLEGGHEVGYVGGLIKSLASSLAAAEDILASAN